jgi:Helicase associated domain
MDEGLCQLSVKGFYSLGFVWRDDRWEVGFSHLKLFSERERHCIVSGQYKTDDGYRLGFWVGRQRRKRDGMDPDRQQRLEALPGWVWKIEK